MTLTWRRLTTGFFIGTLGIFCAYCAEERRPAISPLDKLLTWETTIGDESWELGTRGFPTSDGGYLVGGVTHTLPSRPDAYIIKLDSAGNKISERIVGGAKREWIDDAAILPDGSFVFAGVTDSYAGSSRVYAVAVTHDGSVVWEKAIGTGNTGARGVECTSDDGLAFVGSSGFRFYLCKTNSEAEIQWTQSPDFGEYVQANDLAVAPDSGFVVAGSYGTFGQTRVDALVFLIDGGGRVVWERVLHISGLDIVRDVIALPTGEFLACGSSWTSGDAFLLKLDANGGMLWLRTYDRGGRDSFDDMTQLPNGDILVVGSAQTEGTHIGVWLIRFDPTGDIVWESVFGSLDGGSEVTATPTPDGGYLVVGTAYRGGLAYGDIYVAKLDDKGKL